MAATEAQKAQKADAETKTSSSVSAASHTSSRGHKRSRSGHGQESSSSSHRKCECTTHSHTHDVVIRHSLTATHSAQAAYYSSVFDCQLYITPHSVLPCRVLLDTGALNSNIASLHVGNWLEQASQGGVGKQRQATHMDSGSDTSSLTAHVVSSNSSENLVVPQAICSPLLNTCVTIKNIFTPTLLIKSKHTDTQSVILNLDIKIVEGFNSPHYDMVIGLPTIQAHSLLSKFALQIEAHCSERGRRDLISPTLTPH